MVFCCSVRFCCELLLPAGEPGRLGWWGGGGGEQPDIPGQRHQDTQKGTTQFLILRSLFCEKRSSWEQVQGCVWTKENTWCRIHCKKSMQTSCLQVDKFYKVFAPFIPPPQNKVCNRQISSTWGLGKKFFVLTFSYFYKETWKSMPSGTFLEVYQPIYLSRYRTYNRYERLLLRNLFFFRFKRKRNNPLSDKVRDTSLFYSYFSDHMFS